MLLITGTPKGGLSFAANVFYQHGFVFPADCDFDGGQWSPTLANTNRAIMNAAKCDVLNWKPIEPTSQMLYLAQNFLSQNIGATALHDINFAFTYPVWQKVIDDVDFFVTFRHPAQSSRSMATAMGIAKMQACSLWSGYAAAVRDFKGPFVEFGAHIPCEELLESYAAAFRFLDLDFSSADFEKCYNSRKFRQYAVYNTTPQCSTLYYQLSNRLEL